MRKHIKSTAALLLLIIFLVSSYLPVVAIGQPESYSSSYNSGERDVVCTTLEGTGAEDYYTGEYTFDSLSALSSSELLSDLRNLMIDTHTYLSTYANCRDYATRTDCENGDGSVSLIYTSYVASMSQWGSWNREHVWPKSLGGFNESGAGSDLHHIRPSDQRVNSTRGNDKYGNVSSGSRVTAAINSSYVGGTSGGGYFEPLDNVKGDVARICLYVYVRWGGTYSQSSKITNVFQSVDVLLEWCENDPVDTWEMGRNEVVESIQGNRNVFIDYPELAWILFDREIPADMTTPSGEAKESGAGSGSGNQGGNDTPACQHTNTEVRNSITADCYNDGYTGDVYCKDCGEKISSGSQIPTTNIHSFGEWTLADDGVTYERVCLQCGEIELLTVDILIATLDSDAEKILILLTLGASDSLLFEEVSK
nr:hypothetical protein [Oscillospiraceae bacterium]